MATPPRNSVTFVDYYGKSAVMWGSCFNAGFPQTDYDLCFASYCDPHFPAPQCKSDSPSFPHPL